jgi:tRNA A37 methylthiotransferase MiaB
MKVVVCNFPPMLDWYLPSAPSILMGACHWLGIETDFIDFNIHKTKTINEWATIVIEKSPTIVALSIFSYLSRSSAEQLAKELKSINPSLTIVAGGAGIKDSINGKVLLDTQHIDNYIDGDGEVSWPNYLINYFDIDQTIDFDNMSTPYIASYDDYDINFYEQAATAYDTKLWVPITGSRGCVRKCTFCEIHEHWKFAQRAPELIANEICAVLDKFPSVHVHFTDSLINGSLPAFYKLLELLKPIKQTYPEFTWGGQFIVRNQKQSGDDYWQAIADSGCSLLEIGVETGSDDLRSQMKKNFTNQDLKHSVEGMSKYGIQCVFLMFVGYPTETLDDFNQSLSLLEEYKPYAGTVITTVQAGWIASIHPGTPLYTASRSDPQMIISEKVNIWYNRANPTLTAQERLRRRKQLAETAVNLGYKMSFDDHVSMANIESDMNKYAGIFRLIEKT